MATQFDPIAKDESLNTTEVTPRNIADVIAEGLKGIEDALPTYSEGDGIDISALKEISVDTTFSEASTRANIASGDPLSTIWGKIKKFFTDLKAVAFSGAAADVTYGAGTVEDALDDINDELTPSTALTFASGNPTYVNNVRKTEYAKVGKVVNFIIFFDLGDSPTNGSTLFTINDSTLFPKINSVVPLVGTLTSSVYKVNLNTNGNIEFNSTQTLSAGSFYSISGTYVCV